MENSGTWLPHVLKTEQVVHVHVHDPASINIHTVRQYPQNMPQERMVPYTGCRGEGGRFQQLSKQHLGRAKHMLAMLWLELASLVFRRMWASSLLACRAQSSQSKISGLLLFFPENG